MFAATPRRHPFQLLFLKATRPPFKHSLLLLSPLVRMASFLSKRLPLSRPKALLLPRPPQASINGSTNPPAATGTHGKTSRRFFRERKPTASTAPSFGFHGCLLLFRAINSSVVFIPNVWCPAARP